MRPGEPNDWLDVGVFVVLATIAIVVAIAAIPPGCWR